MRAIVAISCTLALGVQLPNIQWNVQSVSDAVSPYGVSSCIPLLPWFCEKAIPV